MIRIVIADDHPIFRSGTRSVLESSRHLEIVGEAADGLQAQRLIAETRPDIAVLDLEMPVLTGIDVCLIGRNEKVGTRFILLTMHKERHFLEQSLQAGASGYLLKDNAGQELVEAIEQVWGGGAYVSRQIRHLLAEYERQAPHSDWRNLLTPTERVVLKLIAQGLTSTQIAGQLFVSPGTVENHRYNIGKKLQLEGGKNSLLKFAMQHKDAL